MGIFFEEWNRMENKSGKLSRDDYEKIYSLLESVSPIDGDCGKLCSSACCALDGNFQDGIRDETFFAESDGETDEEVGIYLLPGEEKLHDKNDPWLEWSEEDAQSAGFPESWKEKVFFVKCRGADLCKRELRPIQCRTFPAAPYLTEEGELFLILYTDILPYKCPLVYGGFHLNDDFLAATFSAWSKLIEDQRIFDLVSEDSRFRDEFGMQIVKLYGPEPSY